MRVHGLGQIFEQFGVAAGQRRVVAAKGSLHFLHIRRIQGGLKAVGFEILGAAGKIKGIGINWRIRLQ